MSGIQSLHCTSLKFQPLKDSWPDCSILIDWPLPPGVKTWVHMNFLSLGRCITYVGDKQITELVWWDLMTCGGAWMGLLCRQGALIGTRNYSWRASAIHNTLLIPMGMWQWPWHGWSLLTAHKRESIVLFFTRGALSIAPAFPFSLASLLCVA